MDPSAKVRTRPNYGLQYDPLTSRRGPRPDKSEVTGKVTEVLDAWGGEKPVTIGETLAAGTSSKTFSAWKETYSNRKGPTVWWVTPLLQTPHLRLFPTRARGRKPTSIEIPQKTHDTMIRLKSLRPSAAVVFLPYCP